MLSPEELKKLGDRLRDVENSLDGQIHTKEKARKLREQLEKTPPGDGEVTFEQIIEFCIQEHIDRSNR